MHQQMVTVPKEEYVRLKEQANIDMEFMKSLFDSLADIRAGRVKRVR